MKISNFYKRIRMEIFLPALLMALILFLPFYIIIAQAMGSDNYQIRTDSVNFGGADSSSDNYQVGDTLGEIGTGSSTSDNYSLHAGYWAMQESYIAITSPANLALSSIGGISGEGSEGVISWQVTTDNFAGYALDVKTATNPALKSAAGSFPDYAPAGGDPDYDFTIASTSSAFGFSPEGTDVVTRFKDNGVACNTGSSETSGKCWDGLSTSAKAAAGKSSSNHPSGSTVNVRFRAESGSENIQVSGSYSASIIVTALTL